MGMRAGWGERSVKRDLLSSSFSILLLVFRLWVSIREGREGGSTGLPGVRGRG